MKTLPELEDFLKDTEFNLRCQYELIREKLPLSLHPYIAKLEDDHVKSRYIAERTLWMLDAEEGDNYSRKVRELRLVEGGEA